MATTVRKPVSLDINGSPLTGKLYVFKGWREEIRKTRALGIQDIFRPSKGNPINIDEPILLIRFNIKYNLEEWDSRKTIAVYHMTFLQDEGTLELRLTDLGKFITNFVEVVSSEED